MRYVRTRTGSNVSVNGVQGLLKPSADLIQKLKDAGVLCIPTCGAPRHVQKAEALGADAVIIQGGEGGGHTGVIPTSLEISACADGVDIPVIAAGGFRDGRGLVAAVARGAAGTR